MNQYIEAGKGEFEGVIEFFKKDISSLRTGRAHASMVEHVMVDSYGTKTPLKHVATITTPDPKSLVIQPWDKGMLKEIEKAVIEAKIGIMPVNEGTFIRLNMPQLTAEDRKNLVKTLNQKLEQSRVKTRLVRDKIRESIVRAESDKNITEDEKFNFLTELDSTTKESNETLKKIAEAKEVELNTI